MSDLPRDLRQAVRMLLARPGVTLVALLSLALGIGANVTLFTAVNALLFQELPVRRPAELVALYSTDTVYPGLLESSYLNFVDLRGHREVFAGAAALLAEPMSLSGADQPERLSGEVVSASYFELLGVTAALGHTFTAADEEPPGAHPVAVLSHELWRRKFASDPRVLGRKLILNGHPFTVVGVAPEGFGGTSSFGARDLWVPMSQRREVVQPPLVDWFDKRGSLMVYVIARLRPGVTSERAAAALRTVGAGLEREYPKENKGRGFVLTPLSRLNPNVRPRVTLIATYLMSMVALVLLLACANVANLLLARAHARRREIAARIAVGAGRSHLIRQLLTESLVLALAGGAAGLLFAVWGRSLLWSIRPPTLRSLDLHFEPRVLAFALGVTLATGLLFGIAPALQMLRTDLVPALKNEEAAAGAGRRRFAFRDLLVVVQIALSLLLLIGTGLFLRSLREAQRIAPGFAAGELLTVSFDVSAGGYDEARGIDFCRRVAERAAGLPGVRSAAVAVNRPLAAGRGGRFYIEGRQVPSPQEGVAMSSNGVDEHYFETMGIPLLRGRAFSSRDTLKSPFVAIINETLARRFLPGENPVGLHLHFMGFDEPAEIVGVARDVKYGSLGEEPRPYIYFALSQDAGGETTLYVRAKGDPRQLAESVRRSVQALDPNLPLVDIKTVSEVVSQSLWASRAGAVLLGFFGLLGLALACLGTYGLMSYTVIQRRRELGIRMALGAPRRRVVSRVLGHGAVLLGAGTVLGLLAAAVTTRLISSVLYSVGALDPLTFFVTPLVLAAAGLLASLVPARRATAIDPLLVLRSE